MGLKIYRCKNCGRYTLEEKCPVCGSLTVDPRPAKFSPEDPYGKYRRLAIKENDL
ncbi:RNA-protein complex protein Nop10 [Methanolobus zinderi]|uniref:Ribosome biogenesis protein Nop10 n=1 Tax=Methanolobus zinderi TaxID=536044 RepID=A0A7D5E6S8_9EURY|nr:RNA-protein complex protein Nop10 [Methanolobus zinderi]